MFSPWKLLHPMTFPVLLLVGMMLLTSSPGCEDAGSSTLLSSGEENAEIPAPPKDDSDPLFEAEEGFRLMSLMDFEVFSSGDLKDHPWNVMRQRIICIGEPKGYIYTRKPYHNFTLRVEFRYPFAPKEVPDTPPNTGFLIYGQEPHKIWPTCLEVQGRFDEMAHIKSNSRDIKVEVEDNPQAREEARKPQTEWNSLEIVSRDGALTSYLNGQKIAESKPTELKSGFIGIQAELFTVHFRYLRIRED